MACFYPLLAVDDGYTKQIVGSFRELYDGQLWSQNSEKRITEIRETVVRRFLQNNAAHRVKHVLEVPCGKCIGCRLEYSRQWANRCVLESVLHSAESNWFLTLTIDDDHLVYGGTDLATLHFDDVTAFMKKLRERWSRVHGVDDGIRFYACSEYGDDTLRPHYHNLAFGLPLYDLEYYKTTNNGDVLYKSKELTDLWGKGYVVVGDFNWNTAAYTARYVMKKQNGSNADKYDTLGIEPERVRMSRRPGIARPFLDKFKNEIYRNDEIVLPALPNGRLNVVKPPKYFDKVLDRLNPEKGGDRDLLALVKANRERIADITKEAKKQTQGYDPVDLLDNKKKVKQQKMQIFRRDFEL